MSGVDVLDPIAGFPGTEETSSWGEAPVGILTVEMRVRGNANSYRYHVACFHRFKYMLFQLHSEQRWPVIPMRKIFFEEAEEHEYACDCPGCSKLLVEAVL